MLGQKDLAERAFTKHIFQSELLFKLVATADLAEILLLLSCDEICSLFTKLRGRHGTKVIQVHRFSRKFRFKARFLGN